MADDYLRVLLDHNYTQLGFSMSRFEIVDGVYARGCLHCPCGGKEHFLWFIGENRGVEHITAVAAAILARTASLDHLRRDIAEGTLPAFDAEKHAFQRLSIPRETP